MRWLCSGGVFRACGPAWVFEISGSLLRMRALRRRGAGASAYACARVGGGLHECVPSVAAPEPCIHAVRYLIQAVVDGPYMDMHSHGTCTRQAWRGAVLLILVLRC